MRYSGNIVVLEGLRELRRRLPPGWSVSEPQTSPGPIDAVARVNAPDLSAGEISIEARQRLEPRGVDPLIDAAASLVPASLVVMAPYLSEATRARLRDREVGYLDLTGNVRIILAEPGLFIETQGAAKDPGRAERPARSLRGAKAGRIVRALVDRWQPPGVRELAAETGIDAGYVSRVLAFLDSQALVTRVGRKRVDIEDWTALVRRWAQDAPLESRGAASTYLEPRGLPALVARLAKSDERYVITGSLAAAAFAPIAPPRLATVWIRDASEAAGRLGLRPVDTGANVLLLEPKDDGVFAGAIQRDGVWYAAPSQVAADLLTSPGRGPSEAAELIDWMRTNEEIWRR